MRANRSRKALAASLLCLVVSCTVAGPAFSQASSLLWKIEGNGLSEPSWLYGTQHLMCGEDFIIPEDALERLKTSDGLVLEIDLSDPAIQQQMMQLSQLPEGKRISESIDDDETRNEVEAFLTRHFGAGLEQFGGMRPIMLMTMATTAVAECEQAITSHDIHLMQEAKKLGTEIRALETVEFQFSLFDKIPLDHQVQELVSIVQDPAAERDKFRHMTELYRRQDIGGLYRLISEDEFMQAHNDLLIDERNRTWIPSMEEMSGEKSMFYAVGAGHLPGDMGVINLLREAGFTLTPVLAEDPS